MGRFAIHESGRIIELNVLTAGARGVDAVNTVFRDAADKAPLKGVMGVQEGTFLSVAAWYDNEWGYAARLAETAARIAG